MSLRTASLALALAAGGIAAIPTVAQVKQSRSPNPRGAMELTHAAATPLQPIRYAKIRNVNGQVMVTSPWYDYVPGAPDATVEPMFDCFEPDPLTANGFPTGFCDSCDNHNGNLYCPPIGAAGPSSRWSYPNGSMAWTVNDMTVAPGFEGAPATRLQFAWGWGPISGPCFVAVYASEDFNICGSATPTSGDLPGYVFDFGLVQGGPGAPYNFSNIDLSLTPLDMPVDGTGAYSIILGNAVIGGMIIQENTAGTRPMLWGTGQDESPPDSRPGTQGDTMWADGTPPDGLSDGIMDPNECLSYNFGPGQFCPFRLGSMAIFYGKSGGGPTCYANCDGSTQEPVLNVADFGCFLTKFAAGDPYANCDGSTQEPILNVADFGCFLTKFAAGCP